MKRVSDGLILCVVAVAIACNDSNEGTASCPEGRVAGPDGACNAWEYRYEPAVRLDHDNSRGENHFPGGLNPGEPPKSGFRLIMEPVHLDPFEEISFCYVWDMPQEMANEYIYTMEVHATPGLHHGNLITKVIDPDSPDYPIRPGRQEPGRGICDPFNGLTPRALPQVLYANSTQVSGTENYSFPEGFGLRWLPGRQALISIHFLNTTAAAMWSDVVYDFYTMSEEHLQQEVVAFAMFSDYFTIPAQSDHRLVTECEFRNGGNIVAFMPHMHYRGTGFTIEFIDGPGGNGDTVYEDGLFDTETDIRIYEEPLNLDGYWGMRFTCDWHNELDHAIGYGIGENEMCISFGYVYPPFAQTVGQTTGSSLREDGSEVGNCVSLYLGEAATNVGSYGDNTAGGR